MGSTKPKSKAECLRQIESLKFEIERDKRSIASYQSALRTAGSAEHRKSHKQMIAMYKTEIAKKELKLIT